MTAATPFSAMAHLGPVFFKGRARNLRQRLDALALIAGAMPRPDKVIDREALLAGARQPFAIDPEVAARATGGC